MGETPKQSRAGSPMPRQAGESESIRRDGGFETPLMRQPRGYETPLSRQTEGYETPKSRYVRRCETPMPRGFTGRETPLPRHAGAWDTFIPRFTNLGPALSNGYVHDSPLGTDSDKYSGLESMGADSVICAQKITKNTGDHAKTGSSRSSPAKNSRCSSPLAKSKSDTPLSRKSSTDSPIAKNTAIIGQTRPFLVGASVPLNQRSEPLRSNGLRPNGRPTSQVCFYLT